MIAIGSLVIVRRRVIDDIVDVELGMCPDAVPGWHVPGIIVADSWRSRGISEMIRGVLSV